MITLDARPGPDGIYRVEGEIFDRYEEDTRERIRETIDKISRLAFMGIDFGRADPAPNCSEYFRDGG